MTEEFGGTPVISDFLRECSTLTGLAPEAVLTRVLNVQPVSEDERFAGYLKRANEQTVALWDALDRALVLRNPGAHYVFRQQFVGYRRAQNLSVVAESVRSEIFASVMPKKGSLRVVLPLAPDKFNDVTGVIDLSTVGHHGVGRLGFDIASSADLAAFCTGFREWISPQT